VASALNDEDPPEERRMTFFEHLEELRARLKRVVIAFLVAFIITLTFSFQPVGAVTSERSHTIRTRGPAWETRSRTPVIPPSE